MRTQRTRERVTEFTDIVPYASAPYTDRVGSAWQKVTDVNNGSARPESPCRMDKCFITRYIYNTSDGPRHPNVAAWAPSAYVAIPVFDQAKVRFDRKLRDYVNYKLIGLQEKFSSINFFLELGDVGGMIKSLNKYRYVDYAFGIKPFLDDVKNISSRMTESISAINARLNAYMSPMPINITRKLPVGDTFVTSMGSSTRVMFTGTVTCRFKGLVRIELPLLSRDNRDYTLWLDQIGFHPDLSTAWEAVPFSWMIDWFLPIGKHLDDMSRPWLDPAIFLTGNFSYTYEGTVQGVSIDRRNASFERHEPDLPLFDAVCSGYERTPLHNVEFVVRPRKMEISLNLGNLHQLALLSDIFGPSNEKYAKKQSKLFRDTLNKVRKGKPWPPKLKRGRLDPGLKDLRKKVLGF